MKLLENVAVGIVVEMIRRWRKLVKNLKKLRIKNGATKWNGLEIKEFLKKE